MLERYPGDSRFTSDSQCASATHKYSMLSLKLYYFQRKPSLGSDLCQKFMTHRVNQSFFLWFSSFFLPAWSCMLEFGDHEHLDGLCGSAAFDHLPVQPSSLQAGSLNLLSLTSCISPRSPSVLSSALRWPFSESCFFVKRH